jgi:hypothetical protein
MLQEGKTSSQLRHTLLRGNEERGEDGEFEIKEKFSNTLGTC